MWQVTSSCSTRNNHLGWSIASPLLMYTVLLAPSTPLVGLVEISHRAICGLKYWKGEGRCREGLFCIYKIHSLCIVRFTARVTGTLQTTNSSKYWQYTWLAGTNNLCGCFYREYASWRSRVRVEEKLQKFELPGQYAR